MAFKHGKNTGVLIDAADLTSYFNEASASRDVETAETTTFGNSAKTYIVGLKDGTMSLSGMFDGAADAVDDLIAASLGATAAGNSTIAPEGLTIGNTSLSCATRKTSYEVSSPVGDVVSTSLSIQADGGIDRGVLLGAGTAVTSTATGAAQDNSASSSTGGVGYLHLPANTRDGASTFKVQHSSDDVTYADLITFTAVSTATTTSERVEVTGTVNQYVRASHAPGGSSGSVTYTMAFARK
jgi:hypothetical protein